MQVSMPWSFKIEFMEFHKNVFLTCSPCIFWTMYESLNLFLKTNSLKVSYLQLEYVSVHITCMQF